MPSGSRRRHCRRLIEEWPLWYLTILGRLPFVRVLMETIGASTESQTNAKLPQDGGGCTRKGRVRSSFKRCDKDGLRRRSVYSLRLDGDGERSSVTGAPLQRDDDDTLASIDRSNGDWTSIGLDEPQLVDAVLRQGSEALSNKYRGTLGFEQPARAGRSGDRMRPFGRRDRSQGRFPLCKLLLKRHIPRSQPDDERQHSGSAGEREWTDAPPSAACRSSIRTYVSRRSVLLWRRRNRRHHPGAQRRGGPHFLERKRQHLTSVDERAGPGVCSFALNEVVSDRPFF